MADSTETREPNPDDFRRGHTGLIDFSCPQPGYRALRDDRCPVTFSRNVAFLSHHDDIDAALRDTDTYRSKGRGNVGHRRPTIPMDVDPPEHRRYRRFLDPLFSPREMAPFEGQFRALTNELIDGFIDRGSCELVTEFAVPLPSMMFLRLLGLPEDDLDTLVALKDAVLRPPTTGDVAAHMAESGERLCAYFEAHLAAHGDAPGIIRQMLDAEIDGDRLSHEEVIDILYMITLAGLDTVTSSLECFVVYLAQHPEHRRRLVAEPEVVAAAVEELLRWESPNFMVVRALPADADVRGTTIPAGTPVALLIGSANVDEAAFTDPETVDFERSPNRHMAFGKGIHRCLGSHLARLELRVAVAELHRRIPDYELVLPPAELTWEGAAIRSLRELPIRFPIRA